MPQYYLDVNDNYRDWAALDAFTQGYIECLFFTEHSPAFSFADIEDDKEAWQHALEEGQRLIDHGFTHGVLFARDWNDTRDILTITLCTPEEFNALPRDARGRVSGSAARPVIDIVGQHVAQMFPGGTIAATWSPNRITIKGASNDH